MQIDFDENFLKHLLADLYQRKIQSVIVEGGTLILQTFLNEGFFDEIHVFKTANAIRKGTASPLLPTGVSLVNQTKIGGDWLSFYQQT